MLFVGRVFFAVGTFLTPCVVFAANGTFSEAQDVSASLLSRCWSAGALAGTERERRSTVNRSRVDLDTLRAVTRPYRPPVPKPLRGSIRSVSIPNDEKLIALTFDLCESNGRRTGYDGDVIDYLRAENVKATLFVSGKWFESHPERSAQLIADAAFEIGGHGLSHRDFSRASRATLHDEIYLTEAAFLRARRRLIRKSCAWNRPEILAVQEDLKLMRFPYGWCNAASLSAVGEAGQLAIQWDIVTGDPDPRLSAKRIAKTILDQAHPGAIVIGHANGQGRNTADALRIAIPKLKDKGYRFVTVSELLDAGEPVIAQSCYTERPGDQRYYAKVKKRRKARKK
ncbi:MAG: polysaccharide deacetylase family protein [Methyloceanibacter sp.]|nr:polysaccharide deacetylase family protein [Methyloceanibacter sp.]